MPGTDEVLHPAILPGQRAAGAVSGQLAGCNTRAVTRPLW